MDIQTRPTHISKRDSLKSETHTQTESERMEKHILCKSEAKESWSSNPHIRQNRH